MRRASRCLLYIECGFVLQPIANWQWYGTQITRLFVGSLNEDSIDRSIDWTIAAKMETVYFNFRLVITQFRSRYQVVVCLPHGILHEIREFETWECADLTFDASLRFLHTKILISVRRMCTRAVVSSSSAYTIHFGPFCQFNSDHRSLHDRIELESPLFFIQTDLLRAKHSSVFDIGNPVINP